MTSTTLQKCLAQRIASNHVSGNKFERIKRAKREAMIKHPDSLLIDLGVGEPDSMADARVIQALNSAVHKPENRGYADNGCFLFKQAASAFMRDTFGVTVSPETELVHSIGSKAALSILPACFINPGDVALITTPGYPVFGVHSRDYGGSTHALPLLPENGFLPDLAAIPQNILERSKVLVINYPNNPTGACASADFYKRLIEWGHQHGIVLINDAAYATLTFDGPPTSLLQFDGAKEISLELHSLSKSFNMTGWRLGWVCGNAQLVDAYATIKNNTDSGQFLAIQEAGAFALAHPEIAVNITEKYKRRMGLLIRALRDSGFEAKPSQGTFFLYVKTPKQVSFNGLTVCFSSAADFSEWLILEEQISTVPWDDVGAYTRFSLTFEADSKEKELAIMTALKNRLSKYTFSF
jgi:LL-diaminopimelate aminotransferase